MIQAHGSPSWSSLAPSPTSGASSATAGEATSSLRRRWPSGSQPLLAEHDRLEAQAARGRRERPEPAGRRRRAGGPGRWLTPTASDAQLSEGKAHRDCRADRRGHADGPLRRRARRRRRRPRPHPVVYRRVGLEIGGRPACAAHTGFQPRERRCLTTVSTDYGKRARCCSLAVPNVRRQCNRRHATRSALIRPGGTVFGSTRDAEDRARRRSRRGGQLGGPHSSCCCRGTGQNEVARCWASASPGRTRSGPRARARPRGAGPVARLPRIPPPPDAFVIADLEPAA